MKQSTWKISNNTDSVDIASKCIGLDPRRNTIPRDVADHIHRNRGLHIQIRHNGDAQTFAQANDLAKLLRAAPSMLEALEKIDSMIRELEWFNGEEVAEDEQEAIDFLRATLKSVRGEK